MCHGRREERGEEEFRIYLDYSTCYSCAHTLYTRVPPSFRTPFLSLFFSSLYLFLSVSIFLYLLFFSFSLPLFLSLFLSRQLDPVVRKIPPCHLFVRTLKTACVTTLPPTLNNYNSIRDVLFSILLYPPSSVFPNYLVPASFN